MLIIKLSIVNNLETDMTLRTIIFLMLLNFKRMQLYIKKYLFSVGHHIHYIYYKPFITLKYIKLHA